ncbi:Extracellular serine-rich protein [Ceratocystis fimbriata CBS 114723]|uniref:Extracellular serine-rich protein n=1 Tax=Ceratocystis fimbriata CBS 114723 TaxID=1035309 RepID=A0A2C5X0E8_9PEZI|nr:Extracellular serine-rich protein [Ceratocystis fimbriata CBS 114723]
MRFTLAALLAATAAMAIPTATPEDSPLKVAKRATTHIVYVGDTISPDNIDADVGDKVEFRFLPGVHSVVQSAYTNPCSSNGGFGSTIISTPYEQDHNELAFVITIQNKKRIWYYNGSGRACEKGVVGAINSPETDRRSLAGFRRAAETESHTENSYELKGGSLVSI